MIEVKPLESITSTVRSLYEEFSMKQMLLTKEIAKRLPPLRSTEGTDPMVLVHFFHPLSDWDWYAIEYDPETRLFYGLVNGFDIELGYFSLDEISSISVKGLKMERDLYLQPLRLSVLQSVLSGPF